MCIVDIGPGREVDDVVDELLCGEAGDEPAGEEGLAGAAGTDHGEGELVPDGQLQEELLLESLGGGHDQALAGHRHGHLEKVSWRRIHQWCFVIGGI